MKLKSIALAAALTAALTGCAGWHPHGNWVPRVDTNAKGFDRPTFDRDVVDCQPETNEAVRKDMNASILPALLFGGVGGAASGALGGSVTGGIAGGMVGDSITSGTRGAKDGVLTVQQANRMGITASSEIAMAQCLTRKGYRVTGTGVR
jgi:predicted lipid-binding transport protein (Tim44 family)